jgi:hypothetical protein
MAVTGPAGITADEALRIARLDAEHAYGGLDHFTIHMRKGHDGWHVDYELSNPYWNGGGPHYVIDATTGAIKSKVYEQ